MSVLKGHKELRAVRGKAAGKPSEQELEAINAIALDPQTADSVDVRSFYLAHNAIDRDGEFFDDGLLLDFQKTLPGKGVFVKHPMSYDGDSGPGEGKWFAAQVVTMSQDEARRVLGEPDLQWAPGVTQARLLDCKAFIVKTPDNESLRLKVGAGVATDCSIGFQADHAEAVKDAQGMVVAQRLMGPGAALEGSLVWLGAQPGARAYKGANRRGNENPEETDMSEQLQKDLDTAKARIKTLEQRDASLKAIEGAVGGELAADPAALARAVEDGKAARTALVEEIVGLERGLKMVGDKPEEVQAAKDLHAATPMPRLAAIRDRYKAMKGATATGGDLEQGDGNGTDAGEQIDPATGKAKEKTGGTKGVKSAVMPGIEDNPLLKSA